MIPSAAMTVKRFLFFGAASAFALLALFALLLVLDAAKDAAWRGCQKKDGMPLAVCKVVVEVCRLKDICVVRSG